MEKGTKIINWEQDFLCTTERDQQSRVEFVSDWMPYIVLRSHWCNIVLNVHTRSEMKSDDSKDSFYEELEQVFNRFPKYHM